MDGRFPFLNKQRKIGPVSRFPFLEKPVFRKRETGFCFQKPVFMTENLFLGSESGKTEKWKRNPFSKKTNQFSFSVFPVFQNVENKNGLPYFSSTDCLF